MGCFGLFVDSCHSVGFLENFYKDCTANCVWTWDALVQECGQLLVLGFLFIDL